MSDRKKIRARALVTSAILIGCTTCPVASFAQVSAAGDAALPPASTAPVAAVKPAPLGDNDIIVTANRREERSQKVGVSITAATGLVLSERNVLTSEDLGRLVPGLNATASTGSGVSTFVIRGVGVTDFSDHQEQPNANYQDGVYIPFGTAAGVPLFDLQRVEVLRGPQGTLFGRNATGGLIQYISNKPIAGTSGAVEGAYGMRNLTRTQGFLNVGNDIIAGRLSFYYQSQNGLIENGIGPDRGNKKSYALRGQVQIKPTDSMTINVRVDGFNQNGTAPGYIAKPAYYVDGVNRDLPGNVDAYGTGAGKDPYGYRNPFSGQKVDINDPGLLRKRVRNYSATIAQNIDDVTLTSVTAYGIAHNDYREDTDSTPLSSFTSGNRSRAHDFQQELRINGGTDNFRYTAGIFYLNINGRYSLYNDIVIPATLAPGLGLPTGEVLQSDAYRLNTKSVAVYGQAEYDLISRLTAIVGARYTWDKFRFGFSSACQQTVIGDCAFFGGDGGTALSIVGIAPLTIKESPSDWSGKAQLNYKLTPDILLYASVSKGLKSAGFTAPLSNALPVEPINYKPEKLYTYEIGEKAQFLNRKITLNTSAYYYDYHDFQSFLFQTVVTQVLNRNARAYGGEMELTVRPVRDLSANLGIAYNHFVVKDVLPGLGDQRPTNAPRLQMNWGVTKTFEIDQGLKLDLRYDGRKISSTYYNLVNTPSVRASGYVIHDFSARLESNKGWYAAVYLNNAFNKMYQVGAFDIGVLGYNIRQYGERRTVSGAIGFKF